MTCRTDVGHRQHSGSAQLTLDRKIEVLCVRQLVVNVVSGEIRHWLVDRETQRLICRAPRNRVLEGEALPFAVGASIQTISERFRKVNGARTGPVQAKRSVGHFIEEIQILNRRVIQAKRCADAGFPRSTEDLAQHSIAEAGRVSEADARPKIVVPGGSKRLGNTRISRIYEALGRKRKHLGLLSLNPSLDLALSVIP